MMEWQASDHNTFLDDKFPEHKSELNDEGRSKINCHVPSETLCITVIFKSNMESSLVCVVNNFDSAV